MTPIKLALVDDQNLFLEGMKLVLNTFTELEVVLEANSGTQLLERLTPPLPDVILMDYTMPGMDGYECMTKVKESHPDIKIILLTMHYDEALMAFIMQNGANGYLLKDETSQVVREAILEVVQNDQYFPSYVSKAMLKQLQTQGQIKQKKKIYQSDKVQFSQREQEILAIIGKFSRQEIANQLFISIKTVDFHLKNLRDKTQSSSTAELVRFAIMGGYQE